MSTSKKIITVFNSIIMLLSCLVLLLYPKYGYIFVIFFLDVTLLFKGISMLFYYLTMARFMVGGIATLYKSIIVLDLGLFIFSLDTVEKNLAMLYLIATVAFSGIVDILKARESKSLQAGSWKFQFIYGLIKIVLVIIGFFYLHSAKVLTFIYCFGLVHTAVSNIVSAFRKTAVIYIE